MARASRRAVRVAGTLAAMHARFAAEYLVDMNAKEAAIRAGYAEKSAHVMGCRLLARRDVSEAISAGARERLSQTNLTATRTLEELRRISFSDLRNLVDEHGNLRPLHTLSPEVACAIQSVDIIKRNLTSGDGQTDTIYRVKSWDKMRALELLCRYFGLDTQQIQVSGGVDVRWMTDADTPAAPSSRLPDVTVSAIPAIPESTDSGQ